MCKVFYTLEMSRYQVDLGPSSFCLYFSVVKMTKKDDFFRDMCFDYVSRNQSRNSISINHALKR